MRCSIPTLLAVAILAYGAIPASLDAQAAANALDPSLREYASQIVARPRIAGPADFGTPAALVGRFRSTIIGDHAVPFAFQADDSLSHPLATIGDTLYAINLETGQATPTRVTAVRAIQGSCEAEWHESGWAYSLAGPMSAIFAHDADGYPSVDANQLILLRKPLSTANPFVPAALQQAAQKIHQAELARIEREAVALYGNDIDTEHRGYIHRSLYGSENEHATYDLATIKTIRRGSETFYGMGYSGNEPGNDEAVPEPYSILLDQDGREVSRLPDDVRESLVGDLNADGSDEVVVPETGKVLTYRDNGWTASAQDSFYYPPCKY